MKLDEEQQKKIMKDINQNDFDLICDDCLNKGE